MAQIAVDNTLEGQLANEYHEAKEALRPLEQGFNEKESILVSKLADTMTPGFKSRVTDSKLSTIILERAARVMAQVPTGKVQALTKADAGKSALMNLFLTRYIIPNSNAQFDHLTKLRLWDLYSMVYGVMPVLYDYSITDTYIGPDFWIIPIRDWLPQPGKLSIQDSDHCFVRTRVSVSWLEGLNRDTWDGEVLDYVIREAKKGGKSKTEQDQRQRSVVENMREESVPGGKGEAAQVELLTKYEAGEDGHWTSFFPDYDNRVGRDIENPHQNGKIPIRLKHCFPLIDSIYGLGDFERGKTLQFAMDSLINLYMDGVKMSIFPPTLLQEGGYIASTIKYQPGAKWVIKGPNAVDQLKISPQGLSTFQNTYGFLTSALQSQNGTSDTQVGSADSADSQFGRTPQALKMLAQRESTRDNWDRFMMEKAVEGLYEEMINLVSTNQEKPVDLHIFEAEIEQLKQAGLTDVMEVFESGKAAKITMSKRGKHGIGGCEYKYILDASTTMQKDQEAEHQTLNEIIQAITAAPQLLQVIQQYGKNLDVGELFKRYIISSGVTDWEKIITDQQQGTMSEGQMDQEQPQGPDINQVMQQLSGGQPEPEAPMDPKSDPQFAFMMQHFNELPEDTKHQIIQGFGIPTSGMPTTTAMGHLQQAGGQPGEEPAPEQPTDLSSVFNSEDPRVRALAEELAAHAGGGRG